MRLDHVNPFASRPAYKKWRSFRANLSGRCHVFVYGSVDCRVASSSKAGENLKINPKLDHSSDSIDGPLITGDHMDAGAAQDRDVNYVLMYGEGCYNSEAPSPPRTVALYEKYRGRVNFVIVDLDKPTSSSQSELVKDHYTGSIPHVLVLDKTGKAVYDTAGEVSEAEIGSVLDKALAGNNNLKICEEPESLRCRARRVRPDFFGSSSLISGTKGSGCPFERGARIIHKQRPRPHLRRGSSPPNQRSPSGAAAATSRCARRSQ